jgi:biotin carboxylase
MVALLDFLARRPEIGVVLPLRPRYLKLLGAARDQLNGRVLLAMADSEIVEACLDKQRMYAIAGEAGVPYQPLAVATDRAELVAAADTVGYPCIVRPVEDTDPPMPGQRKALICHDRDALQRTFVTWPETHSQLLVQRFAHGPRHNVHFAAHRGRIIGRVQTTALRTDALDGTGLGVEGMSVQSDERLEQHCDALIGKLGYTGVGLAQFLVPAEGEPSFLELNPRHGTALAFIQHLGLDLANAAIGLAAPGETWTIPEGFEYPVGQRYAWTSKDISGLRGMRSRGQLDLVEALRWFRRAARAAIRADVHLTWSARDPMPTLAVYASWIAWRGRRQKPYA